MSKREVLGPTRWTLSNWGPPLALVFQPLDASSVPVAGVETKDMARGWSLEWWLVEQLEFGNSKMNSIICF